MQFYEVWISTAFHIIMQFYEVWISTAFHIIMQFYERYEWIQIPRTSKLHIENKDQQY